jgi:hypothetical protein
MHLPHEYKSINLLGLPVFLTLSSHRSGGAYSPPAHPVLGHTAPPPHNQRFRVVDLTFRCSVETISRYFQEVLYATSSLHDEMIMPPSTAVHPKILNSTRWYPYFKVRIPKNHFVDMHN